MHWTILVGGFISSKQIGHFPGRGLGLGSLLLIRISKWLDVRNHGLFQSLNLFYWVIGHGSFHIFNLLFQVSHFWVLISPGLSDSTKVRLFGNIPKQVLSQKEISSLHHPEGSIDLCDCTILAKYHYNWTQFGQPYQNSQSQCLFLFSTKHPKSFLYSMYHTFRISSLVLPFG